MHQRPSLPTASLDAPSDPVVRPPEVTVARGPLFGVDTLKGVLGRLARGADDAASAMSLLLVVRTFAMESAEEVVVELKALEVGVLATVEGASHDAWVIEMLPVSLRTVRGVLEDMPELAYGLDRIDRDDALTLRAPQSTYDALSSRMTPVALPSINLLLEAGLLTRRAVDGAP